MGLLTLRDQEMESGVTQREGPGDGFCHNVASISYLWWDFWMWDMGTDGGVWIPDDTHNLGYLAAGDAKAEGRASLCGRGERSAKIIPDSQAKV